MELTLSTCFVQVDDPERALVFYRDLLGLEVRKDVANDGLRWITVGAPTAAGIDIVLTNFVNGDSEDSDIVAGLLAKGVLNGVHFHADDLDAAFERLRDAGAAIVQEPTEQFWGTRDFAVRDPSGNLIRFEQLAPSGSE